VAQMLWQEGFKSLCCTLLRIDRRMSSMRNETSGFDA